jgi:leucyl/phenylalanyl-tRNA--protein transferase
VSPPVEPPSTGWSFGDPRGWDPEDDLVGVGADLEPGTVLTAYRQGVFPMPLGRRRDPMAWWSPARRGVLPLPALVVSRSLRRSVRDFEIRVDTAFEEVLAACSAPDRPGGWIDDRIATAYHRLHDLGWVHSVEAWRDGRLEGGLYGVAVGGLFAGESMFHRARDASKVALVGLVDLLSDEHSPHRLIDVQWVTPHLASLGVGEVSRDDYLARLPGLFRLPQPRLVAIT